MLFREGDIKGAVSEERAVEKNSIDGGFTVEGYPHRPPPAKSFNTRSEV